MPRLVKESQPVSLQPSVDKLTGVFSEMLTVELIAMVISGIAAIAEALASPW